MEITGPKATIPLRVPFDHDLPLLLLTPQYAQNLGRLAATVTKYRKGSILDIGANIGDSIAMIRAHGVTTPCIAIEANQYFFGLLKKNLPSLGIVFTHKALASTTTGFEGVTFESNTGNAIYRVDDASSNVLPTITVQDISERHKDIGPITLIKTDTEGFDLPILHASLNLIGELKPVLFFEYLGLRSDEARHNITLPFFCAEVARLGYTKMLVWDGSGDFVRRVQLSDTEAIEDMHAYILDRFGSKLFDVAVFHEQDRAIYDEVYAEEIAYFDALRRKKLNPAAFKLAR